jgi:hypothetical protein
MQPVLLAAAKIAEKHKFDTNFATHACTEAYSRVHYLKPIKIY